MDKVSVILDHLSCLTVSDGRSTQSGAQDKAGKLKCSSALSVCKHFFLWFIKASPFSTWQKKIKKLQV